MTTLEHGITPANTPEYDEQATCLRILSVANKLINAVHDDPAVPFGPWQVTQGATPDKAVFSYDGTETFSSFSLERDDPFDLRVVRQHITPVMEGTLRSNSTSRVNTASAYHLQTPSLKFTQSGPWVSCTPQERLQYEFKTPHLLAGLSQIEASRGVDPAAATRSPKPGTVSKILSFLRG